jgi:hypothetical protein
MKRLALAVLLASLTAGCCCLFDKGALLHRRAPQPATFSQYHQEGWQWERVDRVLVLPFLNESDYTRAGTEVRAAFTSQFQRMGRFEVVNAAPDDKAALAAQIHRGGRFDELAMLELARSTSSDVIVHGIVTHYSPYPRPRMGLILQAVSPQQGKVIASVDGVWDTTDAVLAERCRTYYRQRHRPLLPVRERNKVYTADDGFAADLALESPALFQRWVCHEAILALMGLPVPGVVSQGMNCQTGPAVDEGTAPQPGCLPVMPAAPVGKVK